MNHQLILDAVKELRQYACQSDDIFIVLDIKECSELLERISKQVKKKESSAHIQYKIDKFFTEEEKQAVKAQRGL